MNKKGFTLIELLAVIVIIAIIALIGIPSVTTIMNNSRKDAMIATAKSMASAARNLSASENYVVPTTGCYVTWSTLNMESNKLPVGGDVDPDKSYVVIASAANKYTYTIHLTNLAATANTTGIVGTITANAGTTGVELSSITRNNVLIGGTITAAAPTGTACSAS